MLNRFLEKINESLNNFKFFLEKNKNFFVKTLICSYLFFLFIFCFDINIISLNNFFSLDLNNCDNFFYLLLEGGFLYIFYILMNIFVETINFISYTPFFVFFDVLHEDIYIFCLNITYFFEFSKFESLTLFYDEIINLFETDYEIFKIIYFKTKRFLKLIIINSNLPIFFYFGFLFILTTLFSFLLLSYLGLYGVFIINLISILMFWFITIFYFNAFYIDNCLYKFNLGK